MASWRMVDSERSLRRARSVSTHSDSPLWCCWESGISAGSRSMLLFCDTLDFRVRVLILFSMPFCVNCGAQIGDQAKFCGGCGRPVVSSAGAPAPVAVEPLDYTIQGDNLQVARIRLKPGQELYAEAGKMVYKTTSVQWETRMSGETLGEKLLGALRRTITGESLFLTYFRSNGPGEVGFAGSYPGRIDRKSVV